MSETLTSGPGAGEIDPAEVAALTDAEVVELIRQGERPFLKILNGELVEVDRQRRRAVLEFDVPATLCHSGDTLQGGFLASMVDTAMAHAVIASTNLALQPPTLELKVSYLKPGRPGFLRAEGWIVRLGKSIGFLEGQLTDADGEIVVKASATCRLVPHSRRQAN